ncbi:MAG: hypothetical protein ACE5GW_05465, partial [Planctomycetota bacterium]
ATPAELAGLARETLPHLCLFLYIGALVMVPAVIVGALQDEKESGMLEVLVAAPLTSRQIFLTIIGARLLLVMQFFIAALPILVLPIALGAGSAAGLFQRLLASTFLGVLASTLYPLLLFASGRSAVEVWGKLLVFLVFTPAVRGIGFTILTVFLLVCAYIYATAMGDPWQRIVGDAALAILVPFWCMGRAIAGGAGAQQGLALTSWVFTLILALFLFKEVAERIDDWVRAQSEGRASRVTAWRWRSDAAARARSFARLIGRGKIHDSGEGEAHDSGAGAAPGEGAAPAKELLSSRTIDNLGPIERRLYRLTGGNALLVKSMFEGTHESILAWGASGMLLMMLVALIGEPDAARVIDGLGAQALLGFIACAAITAVAGSRLLPPRGQARAGDVVLSTPVSGWSFVAGGAGILVLKCWPTLALIAITNLLPLASASAYPWALPSLGVFFLMALLALGVILWANLLLHRSGQRIGTGQRIGGSLAILVILALPAFLIPDAAIALFHPLRAWADGSTGATGMQLLQSCGALAAIDLLILGAFALSFDRLTGRS